MVVREVNQGDPSRLDLNPLTYRRSRRQQFPPEAPELRPLLSLPGLRRTQPHAPPDKPPRNAGNLRLMSSVPCMRGTQQARPVQSPPNALCTRRVPVPSPRRTRPPTPPRPPRKAPGLRQLRELLSVSRFLFPVTSAN